jgi:transcriptional regulator with XRE-family HTH domain
MIQRFLSIHQVIGKGGAMDVQGVLRTAMKDDARSQRELAEASGIHFVNLNRFAAGKKSLTIESAEALANALGLKIILTRLPKKRADKKTKS